jgi:DNA-binding SARP family transcriptional activator
MLDISLLGPTEVRVSGVSVSLSPLERSLLAVLTLSKGTVISTDRIIDCLWGDRHPAAPRSRVHGVVSSLRRKIGDALVTRHPGYLLKADWITVDLDECEELAGKARQAGSAGSAGEAASYLRQALGLWRGEPLDGVSAPGIEFDRTRLTELRVGLLEQRFAAELELGHHAELISELAGAVSAHPLREQLAGQLMLALYRSNRQADALRTYEALRERLAEELGSDPCPDLRRLHATILRGEPASLPTGAPLGPAGAVGAVGAAAPVALAGAAGWAGSAEVRPAQLPAGVGHFTGREPELAALARAVARPPVEPQVLLVSGAGGIGKTALVVQWAHSVADRYPDGQIFVDLHGQTPGHGRSAGSALGLVLGGLGVSRRDIPQTADERAALYRTLVSCRRVLVVADDAESVGQILPLVPPTPASLLVATSRRRLAALAAHHAVRAFHLEPLSPQATRELLARIVGPERLREPGATRVVQWCGGWPLAARLAGTKLAARPGQPLDSFANELDDLADLVLEDDPRSVRAALVSAHRALSPAAAYLFGRIGLCRSPSLVFHSTAADPSMRRVRRLLDELVAVHLLVEVFPGGYRIHDVVRRFARQCGAELLDRDAVDEWVLHRDGAVPGDRMADSHRI